MLPQAHSKTAQATKKPNRLLTTRLLAEANSISIRTLERWVEVGILPKPLRVNGRKFWPVGTVPTFDKPTPDAA